MRRWKRNGLSPGCFGCLHSQKMDWRALFGLAAVSLRALVPSFFVPFHSWTNRRGTYRGVGGWTKAETRSRNRSTLTVFFWNFRAMWPKMVTIAPKTVFTWPNHTLIPSSSTIYPVPSRIAWRTWWERGSLAIEHVRFSSRKGILNDPPFLPPRQTAH